MAKYKIIFGTFPGEEHIVEVEEPTTDYGALIDILIDRLEAEGRKDCFRDPDDIKELGGDVYEDEYVIGGNHGLLLYHGGNLIMCAEHGTNLTGASPVTGIYRQV